MWRRKLHLNSSCFYLNQKSTYRRKAERRRTFRSIHTRNTNTTEVERREIVRWTTQLENIKAFTRASLRRTLTLLPPWRSPLLASLSLYSAQSACVFLRSYPSTRLDSVKCSDFGCALAHFSDKYFEAPFIRLLPKFLYLSLTNRKLCESARAVVFLR